MSVFSTILVPTDLDRPSLDAFAMACSLAREGGRIVLALVLDKQAEPSGNEWLAVQERLAALEASAPSLRIEHVIATGNPAEEIVRIAEETVCDLIVIATHAREGLPRLMLGSVAEEVLRSATCPVLCLKPREFHGHTPPSIGIGSFLQPE